MSHDSSGTPAAPSTPVAFDAVVVGAGLAGLYMLHRLRGLGFSARVYEAGDGVGGTWYWNRYPGARCDVESMDYSYSFSDELQQEWRWTERYASQPEILRYIEPRRGPLRPAPRHPASDARDRGRLRRGDEPLDHRDRPRRPRVGALLHHGDGLPVGRAGAGDRRARDVRGPVVSHRALAARGRRLHRPARRRDRHGLVGDPVDPDHRAAGRHRSSSSSGRRTSACPARNAPLDPDVRARAQGELRRVPPARRASRASGSWCRVNERVRRWTSTPRSAQREYEARWERGGLGFSAAFTDLLTNREANDTAAEFVRAKIRAIVRDPAVAEALSPQGYPIGTKRICVDTGYYETFNRDNVTLVDLRKTPIEAITPRGLTDARRGVRARQHRVRHRLRRHDRRAAQDRHPRARRRLARARSGPTARAPTSA